MYLSPLKTSRTAFTRKCIAEAIIELMQYKEFNHIRITAVIQKAGVSRKTFYNYFDSNYSALKNYMQEMIGEYIAECKTNSEVGNFLEYPHILFSLQFFDQYARFFTTLSKQGLHCLILDGINQFMMEYFSHDSQHKVYEMYCYSGGLMNAFLKWEENGKSEPAEQIAQIIYDLFNKVSV